MRAVVGEVAEVGGSRVTVPWGVPAEVFEDRAEVLASDALQRAGLPGDGDDFGLLATSRPGRYVLMQGRAPVWNPGAEHKDGRDRKSTSLKSSHYCASRMPVSA